MSVLTASTITARDSQARVDALDARRAVASIAQGFLTLAGRWTDASSRGSVRPFCGCHNARRCLVCRYDRSGPLYVTRNTPGPLPDAVAYLVSLDTRPAGYSGTTDPAYADRLAREGAERAERRRVFLALPASEQTRQRKPWLASRDMAREATERLRLEAS
jgi:hypothetical protein